MKNKNYIIKLQDKPRGYKIKVTEHQVAKDVARKFYFQFIQLWWKKVKFTTIDGNEVQGYLNGVKGDFSY